MPTAADLPNLAQALDAAKRREEAVRRVSQCVGSSLDLRQVIEATLAALEAALEPYSCVMLLLPTVAHQLGSPALSRGRSCPPGIDPLCLTHCPFSIEALAKRALVVTRPPDSCGSPCECPMQGDAPSDVVSIVAPLCFGDERFGTLCIRQPAATWTPEHHSVLEAMANQVGLAVHNALVFAQIQRSNRRLQGIVENAGTPIICTDTAGRVLMWSPAAERMFGYDAAEAEGARLAELWGQPDVQQRLAEAAAASRAMTFQSEASTQSGRRLSLRVKASAPRGDAGAAEEVVLAVEDFTESERELRLTRNFLAAALDGIQDFISIIDRDRHVAFANRAACALAAQERRNVLGRCCHKSYWGRGEPCPTCLADKTFDDGQVHHAVFEADIPDRGPRWVERWTYPIVGDDGKPEFVIEYCRDVTENRQQRRQLGRKVHELRQAYRQMASLNNQLLHAEKMASIGKMAAGLAHQIDSPLSTIFGYAKMLMQSLPEGKHQDWLHTISEQAETCRVALRSLLDFSRKSTFERAHVDVNKVVDSVVSLMEYTLRARRIEVGRELAAGLPRVWANEDELQQLLFNLVGNASDAMPNGGRIDISTIAGDDGRAITIRVADTGSGISADNLGRIFEPFFTTKDRGQGTGLGLAVCQDIVQHHGGSIAVKSPIASNGGSEFAICLPVANSKPQRGDAS